LDQRYLNTSLIKPPPLDPFSDEAWEPVWLFVGAEAFIKKEIKSI
jgi:hypothetical protein